MLSVMLGCGFGHIQAADVIVPLDKVAHTLKTATSGDRILISDGTWTDVELRWNQPAEGCRITVQAQNPGKVVISGRSSLRLAGSGLEVGGLTFSKAFPRKGAVVEFRDGKNFANDCRLTNCIIDSCNPPRRDEQMSYVLLYGKNNRVDHCSLTGKLSIGVTMIVMLNDPRCIENNHRIDHNYFGPRPVYGSNGSETMRIGTSQQSYMSSRTVVEHNLYERCNGEVEVISVKSSDNIIRNNTLYECEGVIALRHGLRNTVDGNTFIGNGRRNTGGVRIVDAHHVVRNNRFYGLHGMRFFSALSLMNAVPNSLPNRYVCVSDATIENNLFVDCTNIEIGSGSDLERTLPPADCRFTGNTIINTSLKEPFICISSAEGIAFAGNQVKLAENISVPGFENRPKLKYQSQPAYEQVSKDKGARFSISHSPSVLPSAPYTITLPAGVNRLTEGFVITQPTVMQCEDPSQKAELLFAGSSAQNMITIADGGQLIIRNIRLNGELVPGCAGIRAGIAAEQPMITPYRLTVEDCEFRNMTESHCFAIKGVKGTFADSIIIRRCNFADLSGDAINFAGENDDRGRYSADDMIIEDCTFNRMLGLPINIYRGGSDESTAGPYVAIRRCSFDDCCNKERGSGIRAIGPQWMRIEGCRFSGTGRGGASIRLDEAVWEDIRIDGCTFENSGRVISNYLKQ